MINTNLLPLQSPNRESVINSRIFNSNLLNDGGSDKVSDSEDVAANIHVIKQENYKTSVLSSIFEEMQVINVS